MEKMNNDASGSWFKLFVEHIKDRFSLEEDRASQTEMLETINKGVEYRGVNLWILIFATFVASLGLNVNSIPVIIGAMLISPLMGPIMGMGFAVAINNFEMLKRSLRNFGFMVLLAIITSTLYFLISPMSNAQSELLARTAPTSYDVLIALFGGLAGMVAQTRRSSSFTVVSGVAIATALMPPLCTAGFGLATGQMRFFFGAAYLFFINTVFIAIASYVIARVMKYEKKVFLDKQREKQVKRYIVAIVVVTLVPSIFMSYNIVRSSSFDYNADRFVAEMFDYADTRVASYIKEYKRKGKDSYIEIFLVGQTLSGDAIESARAQMENFGLKDVDLIVKQNDANQIDVGTLQKSYVQLLDEKNSELAELKTRLALLETNKVDADDIASESVVIDDKVGKMSLHYHVAYDTYGVPRDTVLVAIVTPVDSMATVGKQRIADWLKLRTKCARVKVYCESE